MFYVFMASQKELEQYASELGKKLGFLAASLKTDIETKEAVLAMAEEMSIEQLESFVNILETRFLDENTGFIEEKLAEELERLKNDTVEKKEKLYKDTIRRINV